MSISSDFLYFEFFLNFLNTVAVLKKLYMYTHEGDMSLQALMSVLPLVVEVKKLARQNVAFFDRISTNTANFRQTLRFFDNGDRESSTF